MAAGVQNLLGFGNPFYPSLGSDGRFALERLVSPQRPDGMQERSRGTRLVLSTFARSDGSSEPPRLKLPWSVDRSELDAFVHPDVRSGGFGPLFALALVAALTALGLGSTARGALRPWCVLAVLLASALVHAGRFGGPAWIHSFTVGSMWAATGATIVSGIAYATDARRALKG